MAAATALAEAIATLDVRYGSRTVSAATTAMESARQRRSLTGTSFDRISGGIGPGEIVALAGEGTCGKVTLALRAVAGAQQEGGMVLWGDAARSFGLVLFAGAVALAFASRTARRLQRSVSGR